MKNVPNEKENQIFGASGRIIVTWMDERLAWDQATYDGIDSVFLRSSQIWKPELALDSLVEDQNTLTDDSSNVRCESTGKVVWQQWRNFKLYCMVRNDYFPGEKQDCSLDVIVMNYNISEVSLGFLDIAIDIVYMREVADFEVTETNKGSSTVAVKVDNETSFEYPQIKFVITIQRVYKDGGAFLIPLVITMFLIPLTFLIPFDSGERLSYILSIYLSLTFMMTVLLDELPPEYLAITGLTSADSKTEITGIENSGNVKRSVVTAEHNMVTLTTNKDDSITHKQIVEKAILLVERFLFEDLTSDDDSSNVRYDYTGKVEWQQRRHFKLYCKIRKDYCPLEEQTCRFDVVGSSYNISEVSLGFLATAIDTKYIR
ncbi:hypothetical protein DPMN_185359 [Dreissena polymorpha]|uniref:Neurotransmitter-gated ion-channel ligand-binding domain-containing protein n=1 Tax=Dreissena polymorpha TaxID=45954 RepID=A0A9D4DK88_DREPO|nr:hypothetical protein DPMN_185359 [Dreissena polymorpha]